MKLIQFLENSLNKINILSSLNEIFYQFTKEIIDREEAISKMKTEIRNSEFSWVLDSLKGIKEPILYLNTIKGLLKK